MNMKPFLSLVVVAMAFGCAQQAETKTETTDTTTTAAAEKGKHEGHEHKEGAACTECAQATSQILHPEVTTTKGPNGETIIHAGLKLEGAEVVTVAQLIADPDKWAGKTVKIAGNVSAMCSHKRAWFAVVADDKTGDHVRIFTAPNFLVPQDSIGKSAVAEGRVEIVEIPVERAKHMAKQHKLGEPEDIKAPLKRVLIRATGADFS